MVSGAFAGAKYSRSDELPARLPEILGLFQQLLTQRETADEAMAFLGTILRYLVQVAGQLDESTFQAAISQSLPQRLEKLSCQH